MARTRWTRQVARAAVRSAALIAPALALGGPAAVAEEPVAPPPATSGLLSPAPESKRATTEYSHGDPSPREQQLLEFINRARLDPSGEGTRILRDYDDPLIGSIVQRFIDRRDGVKEFTRLENRKAFRGYDRRPPLAFNAALLQAAEEWSQVQLDQDQQAGFIFGFPSVAQRIATAGYSGALFSELVTGFAANPLFAHASFAVDWGQSAPTQAQLAADPTLVAGRPLLGHRIVLMNPNANPSLDHREVGIGIELQTGTGLLGPEVVTIDLAIPADPQRRFITGVVWEDRDFDGTYDLFEGVAGVRVESDVSDFYAITSASGGYSIPIDKDAGQMTVTAEAVDGLCDGAACSTGDQPPRFAAVTTSTYEIDPSGGNVKADFQPLPPDPPLAPQVFAGAGGELTDGTRFESVIDVPVFDPDVLTLGAVQVAVQIAHPDRSELTIRLQAPDGSEILLWDHDVPHADLRGVFDRTLQPRESLRDLAGRRYWGAWRLIVDDRGGGAAGTLESWTLSVTPTWARPLDADRTNLGLRRVTLRDRRRGASPRGTLAIDADVDIGERFAADADQAAFVRLLDPADGDAELLRVDLTRRAESQPGILAGARVRARLQTRLRGTSRARLRVRASGFELPPLPATPKVLVAEVVVGEAVTRSTFHLSSGMYTRSRQLPEGNAFQIDRVTSFVFGSERHTTVTGRYSEAGLSEPVGIVEFTVGDFRAAIGSTQLRRTGFGPSFLYTPDSSGGLRSLRVHTAKGRFSARVVTPHDVVIDGRIPVSLRIGAFFGADEVVPSTRDGITRY